MTWICFSWVKRTLHDWLRILIGLLIYSFGVYLTIYANIGLAPWDCLGMGIAMHTPLTYGSVMLLIGVAVIIIQLLMKERIGFATVFDALLTGNLVQWFLSGSTNLRSQSIWLNICFMLAGFLLISVGTWVYMRAEMGCGPKDGLLIAFGKRMPKMGSCDSIRMATRRHCWYWHRYIYLRRRWDHVPVLQCRSFRAEETASQKHFGNDAQNRESRQGSR